MGELEARSRLAAVLEVCERELAALERLGDERLKGVVGTMARLRAEIVATLAELPQPPPDHGG